MNDLRIVLLAIGLLIIGGVYYYGIRADKRARQTSPGRRAPRASEEKIELPSIKPRDDDTDYPETLSRVSTLVNDDRAPPTQRGDTRRMREPAPGKEDVVTLYITARAKGVFSGADIIKAAHNVGLQFGDTKVYHHFGVGAMRGSETLFYVANMFEPGIFDLDNSDQFNTRGLAAFLAPAVSVDRRVVFELMLTTVQRLAQMLGGDIRDDTKKLLTTTKIEELRSIVDKAGR